MAIRVRECLALNAPPLKEEGSESVVLSRDMLDVMNHVMFHEFRFVGNVVDFFNPDNSYLDKVIKKRVFFSLSLSKQAVLGGRTSNGHSHYSQHFIHHLGKAPWPQYSAGTNSMCCCI